jgi:outer membrane protein
MERNLRLNEAQKRVEEARNAELRARAVFLPKAMLSAGFNQKGAMLSFPKVLFGQAPKDPGFFIGYKTEWSMRLQVEQPLYTGGRDFYSYQIAQRDLALQQESLQLKKLNLQVEITRGYYGVLLAQRIVKIKEELVASSTKHLSEVEKRQQAGDASRFEKLRAQVQLANLQPDLIRARNALEVAQAQLKNVLGLSQEDLLSVQGNIEMAQEVIDLQAALRQAGEQRPEVRMSRLATEIAERSRKINRARFLPALGAFFTQDFRSNSLDTLYDPMHRNWVVGATLSFALFEGGSAYYQAREERLRVEQAKLRQEQTVRDVQVEVVQAALELKRAQEVIESKKQNVAQAEEALRIANVSYANGVITNLELMDTQLALDQARINYVTAIYDYIVGQANYRRAIAQNL